MVACLITAGLRMQIPDEDSGDILEIFGTGFGYRHEFRYLTGASYDIWRTARGHTIHNDLLWLLVNGGLVQMG